MIIQVNIKNEYGKHRIYPANEAAERLTAIAARKSLTIGDVRNAVALGHVFQVISAPPKSEVAQTIMQISDDGI